MSFILTKYVLPQQDDQKANKQTKKKKPEGSGEVRNMWKHTREAQQGGITNRLAGEEGKTSLRTHIYKTKVLTNRTEEKKGSRRVI